MYKTNPFNCHCRFHALCVTAINPASAHACPHIFTPSEKPLLRTALAELVKQLPLPIRARIRGCFRHVCRDEDDRSCCSSSSSASSAERGPDKEVRDQRRRSVMRLRAPLKPSGVMSGTHPKNARARDGERRASSHRSCVRSAPTNSNQLVNQLAPRVVIARQIRSEMFKFILYR